MGKFYIILLKFSVCPQGHYAHKLRNQTSKLRAQTTRIMSNLKHPGPSQLTCTPVRRYEHNLI